MLKFVVSRASLRIHHDIIPCEGAIQNPDACGRWELQFSSLEDFWEFLNWLTDSDADVLIGPLFGDGWRRLDIIDEA